MANIWTQVRQMWSVRWQRTLYIMFLAELMTAVGFSLIFPFLPLYVKSLGTSTNLSVEFLSGMVFSAQGFTMMLASPIWGSLADRLGRKLMVERSMFGGSVLLLLMAFVTSAEQLVVLRAIQGLVTGTLAAANALVAAEAPRQHTGYAMGLLQVGLGAGLALGPLLGGAMADAFGYASAFYITALMLFLSGVLVWLGVKENFHPTAEQKRQQPNFLQQWRRVVSAQGVPVTYALRFLTQLGRMMIVPIAPLFVAELLLTERGVNTMTGLVVGVSSATTTLSAIYLGRLGDRIGHRKVMIAATLSAALLYLPHSLVTSAWQLLILQALVGVSLGGIIPAISALLAAYTQAGEEGAVYGLDNSINSGARSLAPLLGAGIAALFSLRITFTAAALLFLLTTLYAVRGLPVVRNEVRSNEVGT